MLKPISQRIVSVKTITIAISLAFGSLGNTSAQQPQTTATAPMSQFSSAKLADLEKAFWVCDYIATTRGMGDVLLCTAITEAFKERQFAGDLDKLVEWWRQNRDAQYRVLAAAESLTMSKDTRHE